MGQTQYMSPDSLNIYQYKAYSFNPLFNLFSYEYFLIEMKMTKEVISASLRSYIERLHIIDNGDEELNEIAR